MPFPRTWLVSHKAILAAVAQEPGDRFDRATIMRLFPLKKRAALLLMEEIGPVKVSGRWLVEKTSVLAWLAAQAPEAEQEIERRARWSRSMLRTDAERSTQRPTLLTASLSVEELLAYEQFPAGVTLDAGDPARGTPHRLNIEFWGVDDFNQKLLSTGVVINKNERYSAYFDQAEDQDERAAEAADAAYFAEFIASHPMPNR